MQQDTSTSDVIAAASAIALDLIPATEAAATVTIHGARTVAAMIEQSFDLRRTPEGSKLPIQFADKQIELARRAFEASFEAMSLFKATRVSALSLQKTLGFGAECYCATYSRPSGQLQRVA